MLCCVCVSICICCVSLCVDVRVYSAAVSSPHAEVSPDKGAACPFVSFKASGYYLCGGLAMLCVSEKSESEPHASIEVMWRSTQSQCEEEG